MMFYLKLFGLIIIINRGIT